MKKRSKTDKLCFMIGAAFMTAVIFPFRPRAAKAAWNKVKVEWQ